MVENKKDIVDQQKKHVNVEISDEEALTAKEISDKIDKIEGYIRKAQRKVDIYEKKLEKMVYSEELEAKIQTGKAYFDLKADIEENV
ncbi:hypothetical protein HOC37_02530 [bacterium]|jgi:hypothetical protein|nr:hypothetical protein [bacterium]MBT4551843.1 hypothetical protein [bacterium]MBT5988482.1 hypothetical protein [bacterium]